jgi:hypothetical protein
MKNIVLLGECKRLISSLVTSILDQPCFEMLVCGSIHVVSDGVKYRCIYKEGAIDHRLVDYLHTAHIVLVCYDLEEGDHTCPYWIEAAQQHIPTTPIVAVGLGESEPRASSVSEKYHVTHLVSNPMEDRVVKEYIESAREVAQEETYCCCLKYI